MIQKYKKLFDKITDLNILKSFDCEYILNNLFDYDTIRYNKHANKTWEYESKNDNLNIISNYNKKPVFYNICNYSSSESENEEYIDIDNDYENTDKEYFDIDNNKNTDCENTDKEYLIQDINPYKLFNPYTDIDIYNKNDTTFLYIIKTLFEILYDYNITDYLNTSELKQLINLLIDMFYIMKKRKIYSYELDDYFENIIIFYKNNELTKYQKNIIKDVLSKNIKTNFYDLIDNYNKVDYETEED